MAEKGKEIIAKHDYLIRANYKLNVNQQRLILNLIAHIHPDDTEFKRYSFRISDLCRLLKLNKKSVAERRQSFQKILNGLQRNLLEIVFHTEGRDILRTPAWINEPEFDWDMDTITLQISETLKPYLLQLKEKGRFASYRLKDVNKFRCEYSFRLLEFCRNFNPRQSFHDCVRDNRYIKKVSHTLPELKKILGIPARQYQRPYDLKKYVLLPAQKEVHKHTSSYFEFKFLKKGRRVTSVELLIFGDMIAVKKVALSELQETRRDRAMNLGCSLDFATRFVVEYKHKPDEVWQAIMAAEEYREWLSSHGRKLKFAASALRKSLFEGWRSRRWDEQREREMREEMIYAEENSRKALKKILARLAERKATEDRFQEDQWELEEKRQKRKYEQELKTWGKQYDALKPDERLAFVLSVLPQDSLGDLSAEQRGKLEKMTEKFTKTGEKGFREVYDAVFHLLLEYLLPVA